MGNPTHAIFLAGLVNHSNTGKAAILHVFTLPEAGRFDK